MRVCLVVFAICSIAAIVSDAYDYYEKPAYDKQHVYELCKKKFCGTALYYQRFCSSYGKWRVWCYPGDVLEIKRAEYGNFVCKPTDTKLTESFSCGARPKRLTGIIANQCNGKTDCGYNKIRMYISTCAYPVSYSQNMYVEYYCRHSYCEDFCKCVAEDPYNALRCRSYIHYTR